MGLGFQIDVFNNTSMSLEVSSGTPVGMNSGGFPTETLSSLQWMSTFNNNQLYYVEVSGDTGTITINVTANNGESPAPRGFFILEFDTTKLTNFDGIAMFASSGDFSPVPLAGSDGNLWIYPVLYLSVWGEWTEGIVMLVEATGATNKISRPY